MKIKPYSQHQEALDIIREMVENESEPCSFDHHGNCQEHNSFGDDGCVVARGRKLLGLTHSPIKTK